LKGTGYDGWCWRLDGGGGTRRHQEHARRRAADRRRERLQRIARAQSIMREKGIDALYLDVSSSMTYLPD
jgi:hypothetical protein